MNALVYESPLGPMTLVSNGAELTEARWDCPLQAPEQSDEVLCEAARQLSEYFAGERREFTVPLEPFGTDWQRQVWGIMYRDVPWGSLASYGALAKALGRPRAARAVARACGANPLAVFIPCHRIVPVNGLGGYHYGQWRKGALHFIEGITDRLYEFPDKQGGTQGASSPWNF